MNLQSRSGRGLSGQFLDSDTMISAFPRPSPPTAPFYHSGTTHERTAHPAQDYCVPADAPPSKRRKLSLRAKPPAHDQLQTTLDQHFVRPNQPHSLPVTPRPPTKITVTQPRGQLLETVNEVRRPLEVSEDLLAAPIPANTASSLLQQASTRPAVLEKKEEKRTLRSQDDGPRIKSDLATYFPNYEEFMFDVPKEVDFINQDTTLYIIDDTAVLQSEHVSSVKSGKGNTSRGRNSSVNAVATTTPSTPQRHGSSQYNTSPSASLDMIARTLPDRPDDPLDDAHFFKSHRRAERKEKQLRNIERERAMHEKVQLDRILDGLLGHDWLKVLGITGVTDGEAKKFESKRDFYIEEVRALVDKFKLWKELEKKQRIGKSAKEAEESEHDTEGSVEPPSSDLNASASRQLQEEVVTAAARTSTKIKLNFSKHKNITSAPGPLASHQLQLRQEHLSIPPPPQEPITSFYAKRHLRDAALGKARHGRNVTAFGHPIPDMDETEFQVPSEYVTENMLKSNARERRRRNRASAIDGSSAA